MQHMTAATHINPKTTPGGQPSTRLIWAPPL
jgi:hypothetical protein